jgi:hypothetical protein
MSRSRREHENCQTSFGFTDPVPAPSLSATAAAPFQDDDPSSAEQWVTGRCVDRSHEAIYAHLVRRLDDPERRPRPPGGVADKMPHRTLAKTTTAADWQPKIASLMADGLPRTFNRIGVELLDLTADVLFKGPVDQALWLLVEAEALEHTLSVPVLFRARAA